MNAGHAWKAATRTGRGRPRLKQGVINCKHQVQEGASSIIKCILNSLECAQWVHTSVSYVSQVPFTALYMPGSAEHNA